jgi:hypothetical protein
MEKHTEEGVITAAIDSGAVVVVGITAAGGERRWFVVDGDLWRAAHAAIGRTTLCGLRIEYQANDDGGLVWFSVIRDGHVRCPNCRKHIPPHLHPAYCVFGKHPRRALAPSNGARGDET